MALWRGVEVYVDIDMPGHTASIWHAYPELITAYDQRSVGAICCGTAIGPVEAEFPGRARILR